MQQRHYRIPEQPTGYDLRPYDKGLWSVLEPIASTNLITNPSLETNQNGYSGIAGTETFTRVTSTQRYGIYSLQVTPTAATTSGIRYGLTLTAGTTYTLSVDVSARGGIDMVIDVTNNAGTVIATGVSWKGSGRWKRPALTFTPTATQNHYLRVHKVNSTSVVPFFVDGWQLEALPYATTYIDGDQRGYPEDYIDLNGQAKPNPYQWLGTPHASQSRRLDTTRHGGREWTFDSLGLSVLGYTGAGIPPMNIQDTSFYFGGGSFQRKTRAIRNLTLLVAITTSGLMSLDRQIAKAEDLLNSDDGPVTLQYQKSELSPKIDIPVVYEGGLESNRDNLYQERTALSFKNYLPIAERGNLATPLNYQVSVANANSVIQRKPDGTWVAMGAGISTPVGVSINDFQYRSTGVLYIATSSGAVYAWDGTTLSTLTTLAANVTGITRDAADNLYFAVNNGTVVQWNGSGFTTLAATGLTATQEIQVGPDGLLYLTGTASNVAYLKRYSGGAWSTLGSSDTLAGRAFFGLVVTPTTVYVGGKFASVNSVAAASVAQYDLASSTWSAMSSGTVSGTVFEMAQMLDGRIVAGGSWSTLGESTSQNIAAWNGSAWNTISIGTTFVVNDVHVAPDGVVYFVGAQASTATVPDGVIRYENGLLLPIDVDLPGQASLSAVEVAPDGTLSLGYNTTGTAISAVNTVFNYGQANASPLTKFYGPGQLYQLVNYTTGDEIYVNNLVLNDGEVATLDLTPGNVTFTSNFRGNLIGYVAPGSNTSTWSLRPGANNVSSFIGGTTGANTAIYMQNSTSYNTVSEAQ